MVWQGGLGCSGRGKHNGAQEGCAMLIVLGVIFGLAGLYGIAEGVSASAGAETIMHQIYGALHFVLSAICWLGVTVCVAAIEAKQKRK